jgi:hypothetical protein
MLISDNVVLQDLTLHSLKLRKENIEIVEVEGA